NVLWLDVAVHYVAAVGVAQGVRHFLDDLYGLLARGLPLPLQSLAQRLALDVRHHVVQGALGSAGVVQRQDVGVGEPRRDLDLAQEALGAERRGDLGPQHLDRDRPAVLEILREIDRGHPTVADLPLQCVAVGESRAERLELSAHGRGSALSRLTAARASATYGCSSGSACIHTAA